jgi:DNA adenine methylase
MTKAIDQLEISLPISSQPLEKAVNVASVPQRSPFRYPGGKTWLIPYLRQWFGSMQMRPAEFLEPFAGGGIVSLTVAFEGLASHVTMVELDNLVGSVWKTILSDDFEWLAERIKSFDLTSDSVDQVLNAQTFITRERAFQTILRNRVNRGGILAAGAGRLKEGENGKGLKSRWYPETLARRIRDVQKVRECIAFIEGNGLEVMHSLASRRDIVVFIDPPYTASTKRAGSRLYTHSELDHNKLFELTETLQGDFLMTYDNAEEVQSLVRRYNFEMKTIAMKSTHHAAMSELIIGRDLSWLRPL